MVLYKTSEKSLFSCIKDNYKLSLKGRGAIVLRIAYGTSFVKYHK